jgi:hypothetical protein
MNLENRNSPSAKALVVKTTPVGFSVDETFRVSPSRVMVIPRGWRTLRLISNKIPFSTRLFKETSFTGSALHNTLDTNEVQDLLSENLRHVWDSATIGWGRTDIVGSFSEGETEPYFVVRHTDVVRDEDASIWSQGTKPPGHKIQSLIEPEVMYWDDELRSLSDLIPRRTIAIIAHSNENGMRSLGHPILRTLESSE